MVRWKHRSDADKSRILKEQRAMRKKPGHIAANPDFQMDRVAEIYKNMEFPVLCIRHGWVSSKRYTLTIQDHPMLGQGKTYITGKCPRCRRKCQRVLPGGGELMLFGMVLPVLVDNGRITDNR